MGPSLREKEKVPQRNLWVKAGSEYASSRPPRGADSRVFIAQYGTPSARRVAADLWQGMAFSAA
jgi:hypothetical protein